MKKSLIITSLAIVGILSASFLVAQQNEQYQKAQADGDFTDGDWHAVKGSAEVFTDKGDYFEGASGAWMSNFFVKQFDEAVGDYQVTIHMQGTMGFPNSKQVQFGVVPWYLDDNNYLVAYCEWSNETRLQGMYNFNLTGRIDGGMPYRFDGGGYTAKEWDDIWMDGDNTALAAPANAENTIKIVKTRSQDGKYDSFTFFFNGTQLNNGVKYVRDTVKYSARKASCGFYAYNDSFKITDFTVESIENVNYYHSFVGDPATAKGNWSISGNNITASEEGSENPQDIMLVDNKAIADGSYGVQFNPSVSDHSANYGYGALPWYKDEYNYLGVIVEKVGSTTNARFIGKLIAQEGKTLGFTTINEVTQLEIDIADVTAVKVEKRGPKVLLLLNGSKVAEYENKDCITSQTTGLLAYGCHISFNSYEKLNELPYNPYDWFSTTINNKSTFISGATDNLDAYKCSRNLYTISDDAVTANQPTQYTSLYYNSEQFAQMEMIFRVESVVTEECVYGAYPWLEDITSYFRVIVNKDGVLVQSTFNGHPINNTYSLPTGYTFTSTSGESRMIKINLAYNGNTTIALGMRDTDSNDTYFDVVSENDNFKIEGRNTDVSPNIGFLCANKGMKCRFVSTKGYVPYQPQRQGSWEFYGSMPDTWTVIDDNTFQTSQRNGTAYMDAKALTPASDKANFYMGATITITNASQAEHKAAFYPWYKDSNNYIIVMLSKWAVNPTPSIVFTGRINGQVLGGREWHDYSTAYSFENKANKFEVQIEGDRIMAYLNGATTPTQAVTFEGISNRDLNNAKTGFFFYNDDVLFDEFNVCSDTRVYASTEKPVINHMGSIKTEGEVGQQIVLPAFYAENSTGDTLEVNVEVKDPNNQAVTLERMRFTPAIAGTYHVKVTCVDNWGNEADPFEYDIIVSEGEVTPDPDQPGGGEDGGEQPHQGGEQEPQPAKKKGCKSSVIATSALISVVSLLGASLLVFKKRK